MERSEKYWTGTEAIKKMEERGWTTRFGQRIAEIEARYPEVVFKGIHQDKDMTYELAVSAKENGVLDDAIVLVRKEAKSDY